MVKLSDLTPLNVQEEKKRFFESDSYNPQFSYATTFNREELEAWGKPSAEVARFIKNHVKKLPSRITSSQLLTVAEIEAELSRVLKQLKLDQEIVVRFDKNMVSKCRIEGRELIFRLPLAYKKHELTAVLNHEIQTHLLRKVNNAPQPWASKSRPDHLFRATEEGLALLNAYHGSPEQSMFGSYTAYYAIYLAHATSFREGFQELLDFGLTEDRAWRLMIRGKRGVADTSTSVGGLTKDITYLLGAAEMWLWLMNSSHDPHDLYLGRIGLQEIESLKPTAKTDHLRYPLFFNDLKQYLQSIKQLGKDNYLDQIPINYQ